MKAMGRPWGAAARAWISLGVLVLGFAVAMRFASAASFAGEPWIWLGAAGVCVVVAVAMRGIGARVMLLVAVACLGSAWWLIRIGVPVRDASISLAPSGVATIGGVVVSQPRVIATSRTFGPAAVQSFDVRVDRIDGDPVRWRAGDVVRVWCAGRVEVGAGERVRCRATIEPVEGPRNPGERDARVRAAQDRLIGHAHTSASLIERLGRAPGVGAAMLRASAWLRARAEVALGDEGSRGAALVRSLILGEDDGRTGELAPAREAFTRVGMSHVLAISGFHLVVLVWTVIVVLRLFGDRGALEPLTVGALVVLYLLIVPAEAPVVRAGIMALAFLGADAMGRRHDRLAVLGWVACGLLLWRPADAFSLGFQLSVGLTGTLLLLGTRVNDRIWGPRLRGGATTPDPTVWSWVVGSARSLVSATLLCWVVGAPLIAWHTGSVSVLAMPATLVVVPLCVVLMWLGFVALLGGMIWPPIARVLDLVVHGLGEGIADIVLWFDESGVSLVRVAPFTFLLAASATGLALWWCASGRWRSAPHWLATALVIGWGAMELRTSASLAPDVSVRLDTLAVGDGTCHIVRAGGRAGDEAMLWDCGSLARSDVGARTLPRAARALGITRIPVAVLTHPNLDHYNGLLDAARTMGLRTLLVGDATLDEVMASGDTRLGVMMRELERRGVEIRRVGAGDVLEVGEVRVEFIWPEEGFESGEPNERSLVARIGREGAGTDVLMTGDIQAEAIDAITRAHPALRTRVMEMPHHGSVIRESRGVVATVDPRVVHQSTGPRRAEGDPWAPEREGRWWGVTATDGALWTEVLRNGAIRSGSVRSGSMRSGWTRERS